MTVQAILLAASVFAATSRVSRWLRAYLCMAVGLALIEAVLLVSGFPVDSKLYGAMWALYNVAMLSFATAYARPSARVMLLAVAALALVRTPTRWYLWLAGAKAVWCFALGVALIIEGSGAVAWIFGAYWTLSSAWYAAFAAFDGATWRANLWLPSALSIAAYLAIGTVARRRLGTREASCSLTPTW